VYLLFQSFSVDVLRKVRGFFIDMVLDTETVADSLMCLDHACSELLPEVADIDFDDFLICPCVIDSPDSLCEFSLGEYTRTILHEVEEELIFTPGELYGGSVLDNFMI
jgi:hypothetical protein